MRAKKRREPIGRTWSGKERHIENAVSLVLSKANRAMSIPEIVEQLISRELIQFITRTPNKTVYATILRANIRLKSEGKPPVFQRILDKRKVYYAIRRLKP